MFKSIGKQEIQAIQKVCVRVTNDRAQTEMAGNPTCYCVVGVNDRPHLWFIRRGTQEVNQQAGRSLMALQK